MNQKPLPDVRSKSGEAYGFDSTVMRGSMGMTRGQDFLKGGGGGGGGLMVMCGCMAMAGGAREREHGRCA